MLPAQPPLPTPWNFPFQPEAGSQISTRMSESLLGVSVIATRQNGGRSLNAAAAWGFAPGGTNAPAATFCASVTLASENFIDIRLSHGAAVEIVLNISSSDEPKPIREM